MPVRFVFGARREQDIGRRLEIAVEAKERPPFAGWGKDGHFRFGRGRFNGEVGVADIVSTFPQIGRDRFEEVRKSGYRLLGRGTVSAVELGEYS